MSIKFVEKLQQVQSKHFINGQFVSSKQGTKFPVYNPSTQQIIGYGITGTQQDVQLAVSAAQSAFNGWKTMSPSERSKILLKFADLIDSNAQWLGYFQSLNAGKPLTGVIRDQVPMTAQCYRYFAGQVDKIKGNTLPMSQGFFGLTIKQPIGVVGQIIPWNYPLMMMAWKCAPALCAGCCIVLKPAQQTPFTALMLGKLANQAGIPKGVLNIVSGQGKTGQLITNNKGINKVSFTGSTQVGYLVIKNSQVNSIKPVTLQLGGKSANIIFPDADIDQAVEQASIIFSNAGQSCIAGSRTFVHASIYDQFIQKAKKYADSIIVGNPFDQNSQQGPQISEFQFKKILNYIDLGVKQGAKLITGGKRVGQKGYFIAPTIFADVKDQHTIAKQQIFGPVMSVLKFETQQQVVQRANSLPYGLGAGIVTKDINRVLGLIPKLQAGTVYVNCYDYQQGCTPFGGVKDSGIGKDLGDQGLQSYLMTKTVVMKSPI